MKVVLFCGGMGTRIRDFSDKIPKPMVPIGYRPILWNVMKYYASYGHKEFILCLGYKADVIKNYFLNYDECLSNNFVLSGNREYIELLNTDIHDWEITFVDTGINANIGQRLKAVEPFLAGEEYFMANYSDGLTDFHLPDLIDGFTSSDNIGSFLCVRPQQSYHVVDLNDDNKVNSIKELNNSGSWINGGYFIFRQEVFNYIKPGEELVIEPFKRLIKKNKLSAIKHAGFWASMDTFKDKQQLDELFSQGRAPWEVWKDMEDSAG
jgi:glucose-1-phosphate cytidylyltransferase